MEASTYYETSLHCGQAKSAEYLQLNKSDLLKTSCLLTSLMILISFLFPSSTSSLIYHFSDQFSLADVQVLISRDFHFWHMHKGATLR